MKTYFTKRDVLFAIQLARLARMDNEVFEFTDISGLTEVCTYDLKEEYSEEEIIESLMDEDINTFPKL